MYVKNQIPYDVEGVYEGEAEMFIPISRLGDAINDFRHIDGVWYNITNQEIVNCNGEYEEMKRIMTEKAELYLWWD